MKENSADGEQILAVVQKYPRALETGDAALWQSLFWLDDPRFSVVENDRPHAMGREYIDSLTDMIRRRGAGSPAQRWYDTKVYFLAPDLAYTVSLRDELNIKKTSRVTLILAKKDGEWRVLHAHFSFVPE